MEGWLLLDIATAHVTIGREKEKGDGSLEIERASGAARNGCLDGTKERAKRTILVGSATCLSIDLGYPGDREVKPEEKRQGVQVRDRLFVAKHPTYVSRAANPQG